MMDDIYHYGYRLKNEYALLERAGIADDDREGILGFVGQLKAMNVSDVRLAKYLYILRVCATIVHLSGAGRGDMERLMVALLARGYRSATLADFGPSRPTKGGSPSS